MYKRQSAKATLFSNGNSISMLMDADRKIKAILGSIDNAETQFVDSDWPNLIAEQLMYITDRYINNELTLSEYNNELDELLNSRVAYIG
ncbi:MAG: hypothetical protein EOP46_10915 [Sphingobacteriaceae bacterium]|nr:MAG: hypothetical protein EOP46_10915 [Sphingobacteriaceae bacterium]